MASAIIDGKTVTVENGQTILDAATENGIEIPTLCWYPKLSAVGNCRICLVDVSGAEKLVPACAAPIEDGMEIVTRSPAAVANRKGVLSLLLERYPTEHLLKQSTPGNIFETYLAEYGVVPTPDAKRELPLRTGDERPGDPMIRHDMSTCILCTRCVRACEEIQVVGVLDIAERGGITRIIVGTDGDPDKAACTWCGECVRVCPTDAIFEFLPRERFGKKLKEIDKITRSVCPYCGVGCQIDLHIKDDTILRVTSPSPTEDTPNDGSTCVKGRFGYDFTSHEDRLTKPLIRRGWEKLDGRWIWTGPTGEGRRSGPWQTIEGEGATLKPMAPPRHQGKRRRDLPLLERTREVSGNRVATPADWYEPFREATWDEAFDLTSQELMRIHGEDGPEALAVFESAKCTNEENYLLQRLFRARFGTNNIDHCTRMCHATSVSAMGDTLATAAASGSMREVEHASDVIFIAGANTAEAHPVFGAALKRAQVRGASLIVADPRQVELASRADVHLQMKPGTDVALFNSMLNHIFAKNLEDSDFIQRRVKNVDAIRTAVAPYTPERGATITGIPANLIEQAAEIYAGGPNTSTLWAMGLTQHLHGHDMVLSLLNLILCTGMIGRWGAAMMPVRGQNNVQGASDMGAIPFVYPDYQPVADPAIRAKFARAWGVDPESMSLTPGMKVTEIAKKGSPVRALYIMGENPIISDPDIARAEDWFCAVDFLVVQDLFLTETARYADVVLPGAAFSEKEGTYVNTERRIQVTEKAVNPPGDALADWQIITEISRRCGLESPFETPEAIMTEISSLAPAWAGVTYERLRGPGLQYPIPDTDHPGTPFLFADRFPTDDGFAHLHAVEYAPPGELPDDEFPFVMSTGRQLYHWHTGTMSRRSTGLDQREPIPTVEINPEDAVDLGVADGELVKITSRRNSIIISTRTSIRVARNQVFVPFHYREAAANLLTNPALESHAKMPELKITAVRIEKV